MLHRLTRVVVGVPDVAATTAFYEEFGLVPEGAGLAGRDGGEQLRLVHAPRRRLIEIAIGADDPDDLARSAAGLEALGAPVEREPAGGRLRAHDAGSEVWVVVEVAPRHEQEAVPAVPSNGPGRAVRVDERAAAVERSEPVRPRNLGHVVFGSTDQERSERFFAAGLGLKISDSAPGLATFLRCSNDHHNVLVQQAPVPYLHHTAWQVDDVDEIGRGAAALLEVDPSRHVWGLGRHHIGSNLFWYLKDPAGNYCEYYSDLDQIVDDDMWAPQAWEGDRGLYSWGPPPPPTFLDPEDLPALAAGGGA